MPNLRFRMLGPLEVERGGDPVALAGRQQRVLLALLLIHANQPLTADRLVEERWGEPTPARALTRLQLAITRLRKTVGVSAEDSNGETLCRSEMLSSKQACVDAIRVVKSGTASGTVHDETGESSGHDLDAKRLLV